MLDSSFKIQCRSFHWVIYLALAVVFSQGVHLHMHDDTHSHGFATQDHQHTYEAHFPHDGAHDHHHGEAHAEIDVTPEGLLKKLGANPMMATLLFAAILLSLPHLSTGVTWRRDDDAPAIRQTDSLRPPLRAPPSQR